MALVAYGGGILDARGSIGGQVHSRNRFGGYVRARTTPVNPSTQRQSVVRAVVASLAQHWGTDLTLEQRAGWDVYAAGTTWINKLGATIALTGFNHFVRTNSARLQAGGAILETAPTTPGLANTDPAITVAAEMATQQIEVAFNNTLSWAASVAGFMSIGLSLPQGPGTVFFTGPYRFVGAVQGATPTPPTTPESFNSPWQISTGQRVRIACRILAPLGKVSDKFYAETIVTAS